MPWETGSVEQSGARFVLEAERSHLSFAELCRRHGIARKTGYKWMERYRTDGLEGMRDRSHCPRSWPHATPDGVIERIVQLRKRRGWGAKKLRKLLERENEGERVGTLERHDSSCAGAPRPREAGEAMPKADPSRRASVRGGPAERGVDRGLQGRVPLGTSDVVLPPDDPGCPQPVPA